jgi:hypothetical protein
VILAVVDWRAHFSRCFRALRSSFNQPPLFFEIVVELCGRDSSNQDFG